MLPRASKSGQNIPKNTKISKESENPKGFRKLKKILKD